MPNRKEAQDVKPSPKSGSGEPAKTRIRIGRACDRCKIKKSKCDGNTPCSTCIASESTCEYSARRRREARDWYWEMQDVIDEALQRLYWACREGRGFPGVVPDESGGRVSTDAILRGLGLSPPPVDNTPPVGSSSGSRSDSVLKVQTHPQRRGLYRPPDFQPRDLSRARTASSAVTPRSIASDDRLTVAEAQAGGPGRRGRKPSRMEVDGEEEEMSDGLPDGLPDDLEQQYQESIEGSIDPAMLQDGDMGLMDGLVYLDTSDMNFGGGGRPGTQSLRMPPQAPAGRFHSHHLPQERYGSGQQPRWQGQGHQADDMLPWPGDMASIHGRAEQKESRGGFDDLADDER